MDASTMLSARQWAEETFGCVHLGDVRRTKRAVQIASAIAHDPAASLPAQMQDEAATEAAYRFLQTPDVTSEQLIEPHVQQTRAQARERGQVLLIQATTSIDYQQHPTTSGPSKGPYPASSIPATIIVPGIMARTVFHANRPISNDLPFLPFLSPLCGKMRFG